MKTRNTEVADGVHQLTTHIAEIDFGFNQYLIAADEPMLFHTGMRGLFPLVSDAASRIVPLTDFGSWSLRPDSGAIVRQLAELEVTTLAPMHGPAFTGDCRTALVGLATALDTRIAR
jgi:hypothetical protein